MTSDDPEPSATSRRIRRELETVRVMIALYCRGHHAAGDRLCDDCQQLWDYAQVRVARCPFAQQKPTCANCAVHCFKPELRERIRGVMRYAGPRMPLRHPVLSVLHFIDGRRPAPRKAKRGSRHRR